MEFFTKKELLEYLGKNPNDNKLIDRMISRKEVRKVDWVYIIDDDELSYLRGRVKELEAKLEEKEKSEPTKQVQIPAQGKNTLIQDMLCHLRYLYDRHWDMRTAMLDITSKYHAAYWGKYNLDDFREELYKKIWFTPDMKDDDDELDFIAKFMKDNE